MPTHHTEEENVIASHPMFGKVLHDAVGRVAFHSYQFTCDGGLDFVQYDFGGKEAFRQVLREPLLITCLYP